MTAGSCFAQHISRTLLDQEFHYYVTEKQPETAGAENENFGVFPARFGNIYTVRQLLQLFERSYGCFEPLDSAWRRTDGAFIDPFRPQIQKSGFATLELLEQDRGSHFAAVRRMFENCNVFIFTLGLTEGWASSKDGAVFPLAPGVVSENMSLDYEFQNFSVDSMISDMNSFIEKLRTVNSRVNIILTVSPVPLVATYEPRHVLVSTIYSKSALRVVVDVVTRSCERASYFPSYEIITGPQARGKYYENDLRNITSEGVEHVMNIFSRHYLAADGASVEIETKKPIATGANFLGNSARLAMSEIVCDEETLDS